MWRSLRVLWLFWSIFFSYGWQWILSKLPLPTGLRQRVEARWEAVHQKNAARLASGFTRLRGIFIKLGQVLSVLGGFLPRAYGRALEKLQDEVPPRPFSEVKERLTEALGDNPLAEFKSFSEEPLAAASLAQVHEAVTKDGRRVAVKLLYPGIQTLIRRDLATIRTLLPVIRRLILVSRVDRVLDQLSAMLNRETDYANERKNIARMHQVFDGMPNVVIPEVVDELSAASVLTMSFEVGSKITDLKAYESMQLEPKAVASLLVECYFRMLFTARIFHADPHPGNFLVRVPEGQAAPTLVILDHGAVEEVTDALAQGMQTVVLGALTRSDDQIIDGLEKMGFVAPGGDRELLAGVAKEYLKVLANVQIDDFSKLDRDTVEKLAGFDQTRGRLREIMRNIEYPEGYFYVERTLVLLFGLVGQLAPKEGLPGLIAPFASQAFLAMATTTPQA
ncbi:MAG: AarF/ABC1/UbiB kinase family protein [Polyangiaceae bacterium]|nr:AarF/ABC1/UbiB kinase family protein [Myxococcales bacterium]MCB9585156.1 AarF/ABC1/UbiB kinase family protein [Polyangiaceae bacterium]